MPGIHRLRVHRPAARDRRAGRDGADAVPAGSVPECAVPVLWAAEGPDQGAVLGGGWLSPVVQAIGEREFPMAEERGGGAAAHGAAIPVADGRVEHRAAEGTSDSGRASCGLIYGLVEKAGFLGIFVV